MINLPNSKHTCRCHSHTKTNRSSNTVRNIVYKTYHLNKILGNKIMEIKEAVHKIVGVDMKAEDATKEATTEEDAPKITLFDADNLETDTIEMYNINTTLKHRKITHKDMDNN